MIAMECLASLTLGRPVHRVRLHQRLGWLVGVSGERDRICAWGSDDGVDGRSPRKLLSDDPAVPGLFPSVVAFHPTRGVLAAANLRRAIRLWDVAEATPIRTLGTSSVEEYEDLLGADVSGGEDPVPGGGATPEFDEQRFDDEVGSFYQYEQSLADKAIRGYHNIAFSASGDRLVAGANSESELAATEVYDLKSARLVALFSNCNGPIALHPEGEILATAIVEEGGISIRFVRLTDTVPCDELGLGIFSMASVDGMAFSPSGDALALVGERLPGRGSRAVQFLVHDFPSCRQRFRVDVDLPGPLPARGPDRACPLVEGVVFSHDHSRLICPWPTGHLVELDARTGRELSRWEAHDGIATTIDVRYDRGLLASGGADGVIKLWSFAEKMPSAVL